MSVQCDISTYGMAQKHLRHSWDVMPDSIKKYQRQKNKENNLEEYEDKKQILFLKEDMKKLESAKRDYSKIIKFYKNKLVELGAMRQLKDTCKTAEEMYSRFKRQVEKEIG